MLLLHSFFQEVNFSAALACPRVNLHPKDGGEWAGMGSLSSHLSFIATSLGSAADLSHLGNRDHTLFGPWEQRQNPFEIIYLMIKILTA